MAEPSIGGASRPTIVVVGAASRDIDSADPRGWRLGGGVTYASMAIARLGLPVRALMGLDADAESAVELSLLRDAGVEIEVVRLTRGPVFDNIERPGGRVQICHQASDELPTAALPAEWRDATGVVLNPVAGELGDGWVSVFAPSTMIALGWQGLFRGLVAGQPVTPRPLRSGALVERADLAVVSAEDARAGGAALAHLLRPGQQLVVTRGPRGALHLTRHGSGITARYLSPLPAAAGGDPTGAGDVLLGTWAAAIAASRMRGCDPERWRALALATAAAAAKVEAATLAEMATLRELCDRLLTPRGAAPPAA
jgi:sugar/nucleoside kinase (ribokinase family)